MLISYAATFEKAAEKAAVVGVEKVADEHTSPTRGMFVERQVDKDPKMQGEDPGASRGWFVEKRQGEDPGAGRAWFVEKRHDGDLSPAMAGM